MSDWWSYSLHDLVLFTAEAYFSLFAYHQLDSWPLQLIAKGGAAMLLLMLLRGRQWLGGLTANVIILWILAAAWAWAGYSFLHLQLASLHPVADTYALVFALQAAALVLYALVCIDSHFDITPGIHSAVAVTLIAAALLVMPTLAWLTGRDWLEAELFGLTPDATALATLGCLLLLRGKYVTWLILIPVSWCFVTGATLWVLAAPEAMLLPTAALLTLIVSLIPRRNAR